MLIVKAKATGAEKPSVGGWVARDEGRRRTLGWFGTLALDGEFVWRFSVWACCRAEVEEKEHAQQLGEEGVPLLRRKETSSRDAMG
jgi:hypothetical protein